MKIKVTLMALIRRSQDLPRVFFWDAEENTKMKTLLSDLGYTVQETRFFQLFATRPDGEEKISKNYILQENDEIFVTIPVGGG